MTENTETSAAVPCRATPHCDYAGGCAKCRPEQWRTINVRIGHYRGTWSGQSFEWSRRGVHDVAKALRDVAAELDAAYDEGFRLYDIGDRTIYLCKGRVKR